MTKFWCLKEPTVTSVRAANEGLSFKTEVYQREKGILQIKFVKTSEILTSPVQHIMQLPMILREIW